MRGHGAGGKDEDGLTDERPVAHPGGVDVAFADDLRIRSGQPAGQEAGDVEFLPGREILAHHDGDLGVEAHGTKLERRVGITS